MAQHVGYRLCWDLRPQESLMHEVYKDLHVFLSTYVTSNQMETTLSDHKRALFLSINLDEVALRQLLPRPYS